jgi:hypothetical protein
MDCARTAQSGVERSRGGGRVFGGGGMHSKWYNTKHCDQIVANKESSCSIARVFQKSRSREGCNTPTVACKGRCRSWPSLGSSRTVFSNT